MPQNDKPAECIDNALKLFTEVRATVLANWGKPMPEMEQGIRKHFEGKTVAEIVDIAADFATLARYLQDMIPGIMAIGRLRMARHPEELHDVFAKHGDKIEPDTMEMLKDKIEEAGGDTSEMPINNITRIKL